MKIYRYEDLYPVPVLEAQPAVLDFGVMLPGQAANKQVTVMLSGVNPYEFPVWAKDHGSPWYFLDFQGQESLDAAAARLTVLVSIPENMPEGRHEAAIKFGISDPTPQDSWPPRLTTTLVRSATVTETWLTISVVVPPSTRATLWRAAKVALAIGLGTLLAVKLVPVIVVVLKVMLALAGVAIVAAIFDRE